MKIHYPTIALLFSCLVNPTVVLAADKALIVGVGEYENPNANLPGISKDIAMAQQLTAHLGFSQNNIKVLRDKQATRQGLREALTDLANTTRTNDKILIYVSSHGSNTKDLNGDEEDGYDETLYLHDGHFTDDELGKLLDKIPSENMVVLIDACHSGSGTRSLAPNSLMSNQTIQIRAKAWNIQTPSKISSKNFTVEAVTGLDTAINQKPPHYLAFAAAQDNQSAQATSEGSMFTRAFLTSFENLRSNKTKMSWRTLYESTRNKLNQALEKYDSSIAFQPNLAGNEKLADKVIQINQTPNYAPMWQETLNSVQSARKNLIIDSPTQLKQGEKLSISINLPHSGYLNVISIGPNDDANLLFPNQYAQDNLVKVQTITVPEAGKFILRANPPYGKHLVAAFLTTKPINLQNNALGNRDNNGDINKLIAQLPLSSIHLLNQNQNYDEKNSYMAGYKIIDITEK